VRISEAKQPDSGGSGYLFVNAEGNSDNSILRISALETKPVSEHPEDSYPQWSFYPMPRPSCFIELKL